MDLVLHPLEKILQWSLEKNGGAEGGGGRKDGEDGDDFLDENNNCHKSDIEQRGETKYFSIFLLVFSLKCILPK